MSGSISDLFDDVEREVNQAADAVETEVTNVFNSVNDPDGSTDTPALNSDVAQITRLYDTTLDRRPDSAGLSFWTNTLRAGADLDDVADVFIASPEFRDRYGDLGTGDFVNLLYRNVLDREPDDAGRAFWTSGIESGALDRNDVVLAFSESGEHVANTPVGNVDPLI